MRWVRYPREQLLPGERALQEAHLHFSALGEPDAVLQEHHVILHNAFANGYELTPSSHQKSWQQAYNLGLISAMCFLVGFPRYSRLVRRCENNPRFWGAWGEIRGTSRVREPQASVTSGSALVPSVRSREAEDICHASSAYGVLGRAVLQARERRRAEYSAPDITETHLPTAYKLRDTVLPPFLSHAS